MGTQTTNNLKKEQAVKLFGTASKLAAALGISKQAVSLWPARRPIPDEHYLRIRYELKPEAFKDAA